MNLEHVTNVDNFFLHSDNITGAQNNITVLQPKSQERLCPDQTVIYQCNISEGITILTWILPSGSGDPIELEFEGTNTNINSLDSSDGKFSASITERVPVNGSTSRFMMTSTLTVQPPLLSLNGTRVECRGSTSDQPIIKVINITLSGR